MLIISEVQFRDALYYKLSQFRFLPINHPRLIRSVSGPGRSGAIASVYASHYLKVPWLPAGSVVPERLKPHLCVDTAGLTGATLRKLARKMQTGLTLCVFEEPPRVYF